MPAEFSKVLKGATILKKNGKSYVSPIYAVAMIWIGWTLVLPLFSIMHYIPLIAVSVAVYNIVNAVVKKMTQMTKKQRHGSGGKIGLRKRLKPKPPKRKRAPATHRLTHLSNSVTMQSVRCAG